MSVTSKFEWLGALRAADLTHAEFRVLVVVSTYTDANGCGAYPGRDRIAVEANVSRTTAREALKSLIAKGWLSVIRPESGHFRGRADVYEIHIPKETKKGSVSDPFSTHKGPISDSKRGQPLTRKGSVTDQKGVSERPPVVNDQVKDQSSNQFTEFIKAYPRYPRQKDAERAYQFARTLIDHEPLMAALGRFSATVQDRTSSQWQFCPGPTTWLSEKQWLNYPEPKGWPSASAIAAPFPDDDLEFIPGPGWGQGTYVKKGSQS